MEESFVNTNQFPHDLLKAESLLGLMSFGLQKYRVKLIEWTMSLEMRKKQNRFDAPDEHSLVNVPLINSNACCFLVRAVKSEPW